MYGCDSCLERCRTLNKVHRNFLSPSCFFFPPPFSIPPPPIFFCYSLRNCILISYISSKKHTLGATAYYLLWCYCFALWVFFSSHLLLLSPVLKKKVLGKSVCHAICTWLTVILPLLFLMRELQSATPARAGEGNANPSPPHPVRTRYWGCCVWQWGKKIT